MANVENLEELCFSQSGRRPRWADQIKLDTVRYSQQSVWVNFVCLLHQPRQHVIRPGADSEDQICEAQAALHGALVK